MPGSEFTSGTERLLDRAEGLCRRRGAQLTELRRYVLGLILDSPKPVGAYDLLDRLRARRKGAAPPTIYRALEFLLEQELIHKLERLSAFVGCVHATEEAHGHRPEDAVQFLICNRCGQAAELTDKQIGRALVGAARRLGFTLSGSTVEVNGVCAVCADAGSVGEAAHGSRR
ncbi:MAG: transcriptional repressor [Acidisphaera sp.]|nr:transcriptional repressor [Acidisphaera sp.]